MNARDWEIKMAKAEGADSEEIAALEDKPKLTTATTSTYNPAEYDKFGRRLVTKTKFFCNRTGCGKELQPDENGKYDLFCEEHS